MLFKFFIEMRKKKYNFNEFKDFCDKLKGVLNIRKQKKIVTESYKTYVKALQNYEKIVSYGINLMDDVDKCSDIIDLRGKKYFKKTLYKEFNNAFIQTSDLKRIQESNKTLQINKEVKKILEWDYK